MIHDMRNHPFVSATATAYFLNVVCVGQKGVANDVYGPIADTHKADTLEACPCNGQGVLHMNQSDVMPKLKLQLT
jgi:hypothetical protein